MAGLLTEGERHGNLVVLAFIGEDEDGEPRYRLRCLRCKTDSCTGRESALLTGRVRMCFDCCQLEKMTPAQRTALAFRRKLSMALEPFPLDWAGAA